jgi:sterol desaturase/sphingolipid hydroxylase (fatty acid hydroxylase superfamily)
MEDLLTKVLTAVGTTALLALVFWRLTLMLPKPEGKTESLKNFHCAHPPSLFNKEFKCEVFYPLINIFISQPLMIVLVYAFIILQADGLPYQVFSHYVLSLPFVLQVLLGLLLIDISLWIRHGFVHKFFWSFHAVHHSAAELSWMTTVRLHPLDQIVMSLIDCVILYIIGFSAEGMACAIIIKDLNNMFVHSNIVLDYSKPWKYIFVSPNMHRWHHAKEKEAHDKNFCVVFAFVDYVMGTYYVPDNALPKAYGSAQSELDDIENKTIVKELLQPFKRSSAQTQVKEPAKPMCPEPA